jgi:hypothetical protein
MPTEVLAMIRDFEDLCTWMYVLISELCAALDPVLVRPGPSPVCTDAELITMTIVGECCGWDQETVLLNRLLGIPDLLHLKSLAFPTH